MDQICDLSTCGNGYSCVQTVVETSAAEYGGASCDPSVGSTVTCQDTSACGALPMFNQSHLDCRKMLAKKYGFLHLSLMLVD